MEETQQTKQQPRKRHRLLLDFLAALFILSVAIYIILAYLNIIPGSVIGYAIATGLFGIIMVELLARIVYYYMLSNVHKAESKTLSDMTRILGFVLILLLVLYVIFGYQYLGGLLVSAGFLGIILGLAAQSTISNFIAGVYLLASNVLEPDDNVVIHTWQYNFQAQSYPHDKFVPGLSGSIEAIGVLYTKMINEEGVPVYIPNNIVAQALIINYHRAKEHMRKIQFDVDISVPFNRLEKIIGDTLKKNNIDLFKVNVEYLHQSFYVVTVHLKLTERDMRPLKSSIFNELISEVNEQRAKKS
ncbi:mechanosensitive ion channel family protein [Candidatus Marsarchaeota archaeon]|nr:mechanosensitive ion channel family protein [Candidatus Marsarchaeota archaeon]